MDETYLQVLLLADDAIAAACAEIAIFWHFLVPLMIRLW